MDAGPDALPGTEHEPQLGAVPPDEADLGPISPELALVDPELARRARALLPEPRERPRAPRPPVPVPAPVPVLEPPPPELPTEHEPEQRRWPRALLLAAAIFAAGAASGTFLHTDDAGTPATALEVLAGAPTTQPRPEPPPPAKTPPLRPPTVTAKRRRPKPKASVPRQRRRHASVVRAANVLGVSAQAGRRGVELEWQRPAGSSHVVVARTQAPDGKRVVVYRGWATSYRDASAKACAAYRYTIVNYDRKGRPSTGVPTSISTRCGG